MPTRPRARADQHVYASLLHNTFRLLGGGAWGRAWTAAWWACDAAAGDAAACAAANASAPLLVGARDLLGAPPPGGRVPFGAGA